MKTKRNKPARVVAAHNTRSRVGREVNTVGYLTLQNWYKKGVKYPGRYQKSSVHRCECLSSSQAVCAIATVSLGIAELSAVGSPVAVGLGTGIGEPSAHSIDTARLLLKPPLTAVYRGPTMEPASRTTLIATRL